MGSTVNWLGNRMTSSGQVLLVTTESLGFIVQILLSDFKSHLTKLVLEVKRGEENHVLNV
jgi:hypothetical protein